MASGSSHLVLRASPAAVALACLLAGCDDAATPRDTGPRDAPLGTLDAWSSDARIGDAPLSDDARLEAGLAMPDASLAPYSLLPEPGLRNPRLHFGDGTVTAGAPTLFPSTPAIEGFPDSPWYVAQWNKTEILSPEVFVLDAADTADPLYGRAAWAFPTPGNSSSLWIYRGPSPSELIFSLHGEHGWLSPGGGSNVFLSSNAIADSATTMESRVSYGLRAQLEDAIVYYATPESMTNGHVIWLFFTGFVFHYVDPGDGARQSLFLQIAHGDSRGRSGRYLVASDGMTLFGDVHAGDPYLDATPAPATPLTPMRFDLNAYLCDAATAEYPTPSGTTFRFPDAARELRNWRFESIYVGIETQDRFGAATAEPEGAIAVTVRVADVDVVKEPGEPSPWAVCP
ncbi:MAG: hypothetical protein U0353_25075 [Sandaracinus sp.]